MLGSGVTYRRSGFIAAAAAVILAAFLTIGYAPPAKALPSYARQTGQPCGTCHTDFAGLTPYGRLFKIQGYTAGGGAYRSRCFLTWDSGRGPYVPPLLAKALQLTIPPTPRSATDPKPYVPPLAMMAIVGFTNTQAPLPPPTAPYNGNNNVVVSPVSFFYGGAITDHIGAFQQVTYNAPPAGRFRHRSVRRPYLDLGQYRRPLRQLDVVRAVQCHLRHYRQQQSDRPGSLEYHAGLGLPLRGVHARAMDLVPPRLSTALLRLMSPARARTRLSTTRFILKPRYTARSVPTRRTVWAPIHSTRPGFSMRRLIGAWPMSRIGAITGSRSERSA